PALALGVDPPDPTQMSEPPRKSTSSLLRGREYLGILFVGIWMGGAALLTYYWPWGHGIGGDSLLEERAAAFTLLALSPLLHALSCRSATASIGALKPIVSVPLVLAIALSAGIHLVAVLVPALRPVFRTYTMTVTEWTILILLSASIVPGVELMKLALKILERIGMGRSLGPVSRRGTEP
ncbi:MAG TPA: cation-translocating P-type ATPase C-terminal domain-containing protein, partial [Polyangiaceae bacterium]|nr:cation-translocating P-type ATPase C-terminal domain-containing protein [Polyangiaceae bacterium]